MLKQGVLPFSYECEPTESGMTALAGLPAYLELAAVARVTGFSPASSGSVSSQAARLDGYPDHNESDLTEYSRWGLC